MAEISGGSDTVNSHASDHEAGTARRELPVDGHVHLHSLECAVLTFDAAARNFRAELAQGSGCVGILLLTQASGEKVFEALRERGRCGDWVIRPCPEESQSLVAERGSDSLIVVCGRQVRCESGLEVTALGTTREFPDGLPLADTVREVQASGALACLPWGFGKWTGARAEVVRRALADNSPALLAVCDNGSRLQLSGRPELVESARMRGHLVLPGTDPFPFGGDYSRVGSFGFVAAAPGSSTPWRDLHAWLQAQAQSPRAYGRGLGLFRFLFNNIGIQLRNRLGTG